jgi:hypothetical protein
MDARFPVLLATLLAAPAALCDELPLVQAAVHAGYRAGGNLEDATTGGSRDLDDGASFALALELRYGKGDDRFVQLWYSRQPSGVDDGSAQLDVTVEYLHLGGTVPIGDNDRFRGYLAAGIGATRFAPSGAAASDLTRFSGSLGFGIAVPVSRRAAFRFEARGYVTLVDSDTSIFCRSDDGSGFCRIVASGSTIVQGELLAGFAVGF